MNIKTYNSTYSIDIIWEYFITESLNLNLMSIRFEYWQSEEDGQWYYHLIAPNGGIIVHSGAYNTEDECLQGIEDLRRYARTTIVIQPDVELF